MELLRQHVPNPMTGIFAPSEPNGRAASKSTQREAVWRGLISAKSEGLVREIGVSNYNRAQIEQLVAATGVKPAVVQLEYHPWVGNATHEYVRWLQGQGIAVTAYASLRPRGQQFVAGFDGVAQVANRHGVTSSQVLLGWAIARRVAVIPGATSKAHILENLQLRGLQLTPEDCELITQKQPLFIDVPVANVERRGGAPLEVWQGTNDALYEQVLAHAKAWVSATPCPRQYFDCYPEVQALTQVWPSALRFSRVGEVTVRNPATWHRGTPNDLDVVRDQFLFMFTRRL